MMNKRKNKLWKAAEVLGTMLILILLLTGCQLAQETAGMPQSDQLCGLFLTVGPQDYQTREPVFDSALLDSSSTDYFNLNNLETVSSNKVEGMVYDDGTAEFEGAKGYYMGLAQIVDDQGNVLSSSIGAPYFQDLNYTVSSKDGVSENSIEATLCFSSKSSDTININPVYLRADGSYYMAVGELMGYMLGGVSNSTGLIYTTTIDSSFKTTIDGKSQTEKNTFTCKLAVTDEVQNIQIKEMNGNDELVKTTQYLRSDPDEFVVDKGTSYVIVEEAMGASADSDGIKRSIYSMDRNETDLNPITHTCNYAEEDGVIKGKTIQFVFHDKGK